MLQAKHFARSQDVKIPSLDCLIGRYISWEEYYYRPEDNFSSSTDHQGTIVAIDKWHLIIKSKNGRRRKVDKWEIHNGLYGDEDIRQLIGRNCSALRKYDKLAAREVNLTEYDIYKLLDPTDGFIHYVGMSMDAEFRFHQHLTQTSDNGKITPKIIWIQGLLNLGLSPDFEVIETVKGRLNALEREQYWILFYFNQGMPLTNIQDGMV